MPGTTSYAMPASASARASSAPRALAEAGIHYEVVPGITSAIAAPAYGGIPVTTVKLVDEYRIVTGHEDPSKPHSDVDWEAIARVGGTIVILMGVANLASISERLIAGGLSPDTPAAAVRWGTRPDQTVVRSTLSQLHHQRLRPPSTIVVGDVAAQELDWFTGRPLFGTSVVVTRAPEGGGGLAARLRAAGADVVEVPTIRIEEPADGGVALQAAVASVQDYDWVVLTSPNGARRFCERLRDGRDLAGVGLAAIGPGTAAALAERHLVVDLVPERYVAESLLEAFPDPPSDRQGRVLLARAEVAREVLPEGLRARGWQVDVADAYRTLPAQVDDADRERIAAAQVVTFASASAVHNFLAALGPEALPGVIATIGPITSAAVHDAGLRVSVEAEPHTLDGLVAALVEHLGAAAP